MTALRVAFGVALVLAGFAVLLFVDIGIRLNGAFAGLIIAVGVFVVLGRVPGRNTQRPPG
ncbi:hypothetical protein [uncultured Nocardioides sp.]|uniref:hypothetical protein n=1 Tax=uncultured Nocardioides sp. TaxID=198441 RepID=UPI002631BD3C|nr:hypothetical protein [uncultured Nocardioides sp.]